jgi:hypothetical protein
MYVISHYCNRTYASKEYNVVNFRSHLVEGNCNRLPVFLLCQFYIQLAVDMCDICGLRIRGVFTGITNDTAYMQFICKICSIKNFSYALFL